MANCDYKAFPYPGIAAAPECSADTRVWHWRGVRQRICSNCFSAEMTRRATLAAMGPGRGYTLEESDALKYPDGQVVGVWNQSTGYHPTLGPEPVFAFEGLPR